MPKPRFIECGFCGRMFTVHSVEVHETRCTDNPQAVDTSKKASAVVANDNMPQPTIEPSVSQKKPVWMVWGRKGSKDRTEGKNASVTVTMNTSPTVVMNHGSGAGRRYTMVDTVVSAFPWSTPDVVNNDSLYQCAMPASSSSRVAKRRIF
uniref:C2H2-type domain-containing protein n=1 Tax=Plectus sambesii TaxID=2011161 RepID=A0A914XCC8_9BILA